ncbi:hypothetical protein [Thalassospira alkalitolerans]|uniref:hypothetical protein n=1 Tax=Thalassospira alkalitolerans TaxID=1293890 RepID=UPI003AA9A165
MTARDLYRHPLFWVPDAEFQRFNERSLPKCFSFGDMDILEEHNLGDIAENYFRCGEVLIERVYRNDIEDFVAQFPIIYLFRHAFEVRLKQIIESQTGEKASKEHSLHKLMNQVTGLEDWAKRRLQELGDLDPNAELLRYGGVGSNARDYLGTDVRFFHEAVCALRDYLAAFTAAQATRSAS